MTAVTFLRRRLRQRGQTLLLAAGAWLLAKGQGPEIS